MTKEELTENIIKDFKNFCKHKNAYCGKCPYKKYYYCEMRFVISYLNKRHLIKGITNEKENHKNK